MQKAASLLRRRRAVADFTSSGAVARLGKSTSAAGPGTGLSFSDCENSLSRSVKLRNVDLLDGSTRMFKVYKKWGSKHSKKEDALDFL